MEIVKLCGVLMSDLYSDTKQNKKKLCAILLFYMPRPLIVLH